MADDPADDLTDAEIAAMAAAAFTEVHKQRDRTHDQAAAALAAILAALAAGLDAHSLAAAVDPDANRDTRRAAAAAEIERQARILGLDASWHDAARDAHTAATLAGAAAAAHVLSAGDLSAEPQPAGLPNPFDPAGWVATQRRGLAGDVVDLLARAARNAAAEPDLLNPAVPGLLDLAALGLTAADLQAAIADGGGALYYLDLQISGAYLDMTTAVYLDLGFAQYWWCAIGDSRTCATCLAYEAASPYTRSALPDPPHGGCRCFVMPGNADPANRAR